ncbi:MAG TPA: HesA/MoeB/ThiF family protein [Anaerovoracaceae bacterium]|nr:HesA/MoeB/ThiF family protein [Anaerovoracaceae bacterium]
MGNRYLRNMNTFSSEENDKFKNFRVCVVGCGGLGGYVIEMLGRLGIGFITAVDGDVFDETNLNRQLLSSEKLIGREKAQAAKERMSEVNSEVKVIPIIGMLNEDNYREILKGHDIVVDALDNMSSRKILAKGCAELKIPLVHGAIAGWYGQVSTIMPGDNTMERLYRGDENKGVEVELGNPAFTPALVASIQVAEVMKVLTGRGEILQNKLLTLDLLNHEYEVFEI